VSPSATVPAAGLAQPSVAEPVGRWARAWRQARHRPASAGGAAIVLLFITLAIGAPWIAGVDPLQTDWKLIRKAPTMAHPFGTDDLGRDTFARVVWGSRISMQAGVFSILLAIAAGVPIGLVAGYYRGALDQLIMRVTDAWLAFPGILFYLIAATIIQAHKLSLFWNTVGLIIALGVAQTPSMARLVRGSVLAEREREYVEASCVIGEGNLYIAFRQILPNCLSPVIIQGTISLGIEMLVLAALSFLGLGAPPPTPDWGADLNLAREHMETLPYLAIFPGLAISFAVLGFNLFGDGLRDILDPRLADR